MARRFVEASSDRPWVTGLAGKRTGQKFRNQLAEVAPADLAATDPLLLLLLDDVPGLAARRRVRGPLRPRVLVRGAGRAPHRPSPTCAPGGRRTRRSSSRCARVGEIPTPTGPPAPILLDLDLDPLAWHEVDPLGPHGMRRVRRLDVGPSHADPTSWWFDVHFRDSHVSADGAEEVVHEYVVTGTLDPELRRVTTIAAEARVLPWLECPQAVASAGRIVGPTTRRPAGRGPRRAGGHLDVHPPQRRAPHAGRPRPDPHRLDVTVLLEPRR